MPAYREERDVYTVKQLAELAGITVRTLHHYDEIGLLKPSQVGANSYRYYDENALLRLQQILLYREMGMELQQIKAILDDPDFDYIQALRTHRAVLEGRMQRVQELITTVDNTIRHITGENRMSDKGIFKPFNDEEQRHYERLARLEYGPGLVDESVKRWKGYSKAQQQAILDEAGAIYSEIARLMAAEADPRGAEVQAQLTRWHNNLTYFYTPTLDVLRGLSELYVNSAEFHANISKIGDGLPEYLHAGITQYVDDLETAELERMLAEDEKKRGER